MSMTTELGGFESLAKALGILKPNGDPNDQWFADPVGESSNPNGLQEILRDEDQRAALLEFVDEVLGAPDREQRGGATWVPLFREESAHVTIYAVVKPVTGAVHIGIGVEHAMQGAAPRVMTRVHVPVFRAQRGSTPLSGGGSLPPWLLIGRAEGKIEIAVDLALTDAAPAPGEPSLGGLAVQLGIPTDGSANLHLAIELRDLQLPGATSPRSRLTLDAATPGQLGAEVLELLATLVRTQVDALTSTLPQEVKGLLGMLGLCDVANLPPLPLADIPVRGLDAVVEWLRAVFASTAARTAWFQQLGRVIGGTVDAGAQSASVSAGALRFTVGVRTTTGAGGALVVIPWVALSLDTVPGARVAITVDVLRADLASGAVTAIPDLRAEALFGTEAGGAPLMTGDPSVSGLRVGLALTADRRPAFSLTLHTARIAGVTHPVLDLSSPQAAVSAVDSVVQGALQTAMANFGAAGVLVGKLLGITAPAGITAISSTSLLADPLAELTRYWRDLTASSTAMREVLGAFRALVASVPAANVPGNGTRAVPWRVELAAPLVLLVWKDGNALVIDAALDIVTPVFDDCRVTTTLRASLLRLAFTPVQVTFVGSISAAMALTRLDDEPLQLDVGPLSLSATALRAIASWSPQRGLLVDLEAPDARATIELPDDVLRIGLPLPVRDATGALTVPPAAWREAQALIVALSGQLRSPVIDELLAFIGWTGTAPELSLALLVAGDPALVVKQWVADLVLDCDRVRTAMGIVARLLSGGTRREALGAGSLRSPYRAPVAGDDRAPALVSWLVPPCPSRMELGKFIPPRRSPFVPEDGAAMVQRLVNVAVQLPDVRDLLVGRDSLAAGLEALVARWVDTDGVLAVPNALPAGVTLVRRNDVSFDDLLAEGVSGMLARSVFGTVPATVVHVSCEASWVSGMPAGRVVDARTAAATGAITATGTGDWFVVLPSPAVARGARVDRDAVAEMADRLARVLQSRTAPVAVMAYGACGAAAVRAAASRAVISDVVTVGAPWTPPSVTAFRSGLGADALRVVERLLRGDAPPLEARDRALSGTPLDVVRDVVRRSLEAGADDGALPNVAAEVRRAGLTCRAVFGALGGDIVRTGLGAALDDGILARFDASREAADVPAPRTALHVGVDVPVLAATLGGVRVGLGATFDLAALDRSDTEGFTVSTARGVTVHLELAVVDGWLVGGPSPEPGDVDIRWMSADITVPFDGSAGDSEIVLHEATGLGAFRERWVVRADGDGVSATQALPEVRAMLSGVVARVSGLSPQLAVLLDVIGLVREGGLDAQGLDRLLFEPQLVAAQVRARGVELATALRALVGGMAGSAGTMQWTVGDATLSLDAVQRTVGVSVATSLGGAVPCTLEAQLGAGGSATAQCTLGAIDANAGGVRLVGRAGATNSVVVEWGAAGPVPARSMMLLPTPDVAGFTSFASTVVPAFVLHGLATALRDAAQPAARDAMNAALDALSLLKAADAAGRRAILLPVALFDDAAAWLQHGAAAWRTDPVGSSVRLLDALVPVLAPARGASAGWPIADGVVVNYSGAGGRLLLTLDATIDGAVGAAVIATRLVGGVRISGDFRVEPSLSAGVTIDGTGVLLAVSPDVQLSVVRPAPAPLLPIYPAGAGVGALLQGIGETVLPPVLNAVAARRSDAAASLIKDVGTMVFDLGGALDLRQGNTFDAGKISTFAADPASRLLARLPNLVSLGTATLARALDPAATRVRVQGPTSGRVTLQFGSAQQVTLVLDTSGTTPVVKFAAALAVPAVGNIVVEELRLAAEGVGIAVRVGPAALQVGQVTLRPVLTVRAGITPQGVSRMAALGLALDGTGLKSVDLRWALNETPPQLAIVTRGASETVDTDAGRVALSLVAVAAQVACGIALPTLQGVLPADAFTKLERVVFDSSSGSILLDTTLFDDLLQPERLFTRLKRLAWNVAAVGTPLSVTIDGTVVIALAALPGTGSNKRLGVRLSLTDEHARIVIANGDPVVAIELDDSWIEGPDGDAGITITLLEGNVTPQGDVSLELSPGLEIRGVGLRFTKTGGPLLELGPISLDGIAVHLFGEISSVGIGAGVQIELAGLAIAPSGGGGNAVAGGILADAGRGSASNRPAFSPGVAVLARAGGDVGVSVRAGPPPGPWWLVVQRELGPLYLERIGFNSQSANGSITRLQLLFDGRVSIFGMTAAVDQLSLTWNGGDVFDITRWQADLMGLAISADMSGVTLAGGLLKDSSGGYMGMLLGRFGTYGLTVYGGYALLDGNPSFFIFGALNGPIGGPPAFFITGIGAGLGINRQLRVPTDISQFGEYPFIKALDIAASVPDPMVEMRRLNDYFQPQVGEFWVAAGLSFTCFALVDGIAVIAVAFSSEGIDVNLLGLARMALPRPQVALVSIELALLARFSTREGIFSIRAQLTENSWLLYPEVRLTGGFAFVVWWKGPLAGQFVLTIGGYHPRFHRDGYPDVPRVGLMWSVSSAIVIKGGAYFALTSEALMAGIEVVVSADFGFAWARIEFGANGIVYFDPFWFEVEAYARISAGVKIDTWLGTISFSISTGASLLVHGPEFGGRASFDVGPVEITVPFGSDARRQGDFIDWPAFVTKYLEQGEGGGARVLSAITGLGTLPRKAGASKAETADGSAAKPFEVFGEFQIAITTVAPMTEIRIGGVTVTGTPAPRRSDGAATGMGLAPMGAGGLTSILKLTLTGVSGELGVSGPQSDKLRTPADNIAFDIDAFPIGVWGVPTGAPASAIPTGDIINAMNRIRFDLRKQVGNSPLPPVPFRRVKPGRQPLPLQAQGGVRAAIFTTAAGVAVPKPTTVSAAMDEASRRLFATREDPEAAGLLPRGNPGATGAAAYRGDRVAPPMFGTLADGLKPVTGADVLPTAVAPPPAPKAVEVRAPRLVGVLAGGAGVIERGAKTTVKDGRLKRRPAPSVESVRSRLTRELPVQLSRTARPGVSDSGTIIPAGVTPFTAAVGTSRSLAAGRKTSSRAMAGIVAGLDGARPRDAGTPQLNAGDLVVLHSPDAHIDLDARNRPRVGVGGKARVTMTAGDGSVLLDAMSDGVLAVPPSTALVMVQAGGDVAVVDGMAGWHDRTRLARINSRVAVGPGCTLRIDGVVSDAPPAWLGAATLLTQSTAVTTRFVAPARTVAVVLAGSEVPTPDSVTVELLGATRATTKGVERAPRVVMSGTRAVLLYDVKPVRNEVLRVRVLAGGPWRLAGVLAGDQESEAVARTIATRGVEAIAGRLLLAADGAPISVTWQPVAGAGPQRARRKAATKKVTARKTTAQKTTARKTTARKTSTTKVPAKRASAPRKAAAKRKTTTTRRREVRHAR